MKFSPAVIKKLSGLNPLLQKENKISFYECRVGLDTIIEAKMRFLPPVELKCCFAAAVINFAKILLF